MIVMIAIGWVVVLPMLVVGGLYTASKVMDRRARAGVPLGPTASLVPVDVVATKRAAKARRAEKQPVSAGY